MENPISIMNSYWTDLLSRLYEMYDTTKHIQYIIHKCFNSEHSLYHLTNKRFKLLNIILDAFNSYSKVYQVDTYKRKGNSCLTLKQYPTPHQNALYEDDAELIRNYIKTYKEILDELYNQYDFLKEYTDFNKLQYYCIRKKSHMHKLLYKLDYVPILHIPIKS